MKHVFPPPHLLPKVRSTRVTQAIAKMPCNARVSSFVPGHRCAPADTVVPAHVGNVGKGMSTKASDIELVAACLHCHMLIDMVDPRIHDVLRDRPVEFYRRLLSGTAETRAMLVALGILSFDESEIL